MPNIDQAAITAALLGDPEAAKKCTDAHYLLPCPMCGSQDEVGIHLIMDAVRSIRCDKCGLMMDVYDTAARLTAAWNARADLRALAKEATP